MRATRWPVSIFLVFICSSFALAQVTEDFEFDSVDLQADFGLSDDTNNPQTFDLAHIDTDGDGTPDNRVIEVTAPGGWAGGAVRLDFQASAFDFNAELASVVEQGMGGTLSFDVLFRPADNVFEFGLTPRWFEVVGVLQTGWSDDINGTFPNIWGQEIINPAFDLGADPDVFQKMTLEFPIEAGTRDTADEVGAFERDAQFEVMTRDDSSYPADGPPFDGPYQWANFFFGTNNEADAVIETKVYFDNFTITANRENTGGLVCDFDGDGQCDLADMDDLYANLGAAGGAQDIDGSGAVDGSDISAWLAAASDASNPFNADGKTFTLGDVDLDGDVDSTDLGLLLNNFGSDSRATYGGGNLNGDAAVDSTDLGLLLNNFNFSSASSSAVPEPSGLALFLVALSGLGVARRRRG